MSSTRYFYFQCLWKIALCCRRAWKKSNESRNSWAGPRTRSWPRSPLEQQVLREISTGRRKISLDIPQFLADSIDYACDQETEMPTDLMLMREVWNKFFLVQYCRDFYFYYVCVFIYFIFFLYFHHHHHHHSTFMTSRNKHEALGIRSSIGRNGCSSTTFILEDNLSRDFRYQMSNIEYPFVNNDWLWV